MAECKDPSTFSNVSSVNNTASNLHVCFGSMRIFSRQNQKLSSGMRCKLFEQRRQYSVRANMKEFDFKTRECLILYSVIYILLSRS